MVRPIVPNQALLTLEDKCYYNHLEWTVGHTDPAWIDHFYKGWGRMVHDDAAHDSLANFDKTILPKLMDAVKNLDSCAALSDTARDVRDRIRTFHHVFATDRNLIEVQEAIHACLADNRERPEASGHRQRIRRAMERELANVREFIDLLESSSSTLIPTTSWEETTYIHRSPLSHLLKLKLGRMERHIDDPPGPWFRELEQPGGWTSDLRGKLPDA